MSLRERIQAEIERREGISRVDLEVEGGHWEAEYLGDLLWQVYERFPDGESSDGIVVETVETTATFMTTHDPADALRRYAGYRMLLSIAGVMQEQAKLKQQAADRFGDPKDNSDMTGPDRIAWLLQSDMALTYAEHARQITATIAEALGIEADQ